MADKANLIDPKTLSMIPTDSDTVTPELVLAVQRLALTKLGVGIDGIYPLDFDEVDSSAYAFLPRHIADNKKELLADSLVLGRMFPQVLPYFQIVDTEGRYLVYRRIGKESGLHEKYSIGVGGHIDTWDSFWLYSGSHYQPKVATNSVGLHRRSRLQDITATGAERELKEEINYIHHGQFEFDRVISTFEDDTSVMHIGLPLELHLSPEPTDKAWDVDTLNNTFSKLKFEEAEFPGVEWLTKEELKAKLKEEGVVFEAWSRLLVEAM